MSLDGDPSSATLVALADVRVRMGARTPAMRTYDLARYLELGDSAQRHYAKDAAHLNGPPRVHVRQVDFEIGEQSRSSLLLRCLAWSTVP